MSGCRARQGRIFELGMTSHCPCPTSPSGCFCARKGKKKKKIYEGSGKKKKKGKERKIPQDKRDEKFKAVLKQLVKAGAQADLKSEQ